MLGVTTPARASTWWCPPSITGTAGAGLGPAGAVLAFFSLLGARSCLGADDSKLSTVRRTTRSSRASAVSDQHTFWLRQAPDERRVPHGEPRTEFRRARAHPRPRAIRPSRREHSTR